MAGLAGGKKQCVREDGGVKTDEVRVLERELAFYKLKAEQMEYKVQEVSQFMTASMLMLHFRSTAAPVTVKV